MLKSYSVDVTSPLARAMLQPDAQQQGRQVVQLAGDVPDPTGYTQNLGIQSTHRLNAGKREVLVLYKDLILTVDVYALPGEPTQVHVICPRCRKPSRITAENKAIDFDPAGINPMRNAILRVSAAPEIAGLADFGRLSVEPFECAWELGGDRHVVGGLHTGVSLCRQRLVIDDNRARDA